MSYAGAQPILFVEDGRVNAPLHEEFSTTNFQHGCSKRIDTKMIIDTMLDIDNAQARNRTIQTDLSGISVQRRKTYSRGDVPSENEVAHTSREAISFIAPMTAVARAVLGQPPIHFDRRRTA